MNEITGLQQFWLRNQSELVKTLKDVQKQSEDMEYLKKQYTILLQKKLRIEGLWQTSFSILKSYEQSMFYLGASCKERKKGRAKTLWQTPLFPLGLFGFSLNELGEYMSYLRFVNL